MPFSATIVDVLLSDPQTVAVTVRWQDGTDQVFRLLSAEASRQEIRRAIKVEVDRRNKAEKDANELRDLIGTVIS